MSIFRFKSQTLKDLNWRTQDKINNCLNILNSPTTDYRNLIKTNYAQMFTLDDCRKSWFSLLKENNSLPDNFMIKKLVMDFS